jgi:hypothetical protein
LPDSVTLNLLLAFHLLEKNLTKSLSALPHYALVKRHQHDHLPYSGSNDSKLAVSAEHSHRFPENN